jgi:hypothetical protein
MTLITSTYKICTRLKCLAIYVSLRLSKAYVSLRPSKVGFLCIFDDSCQPEALEGFRLIPDGSCQPQAFKGYLINNFCVN